MIFIFKFVFCKFAHEFPDDKDTNNLSLSLHRLSALYRFGKFKIVILYKLGDITSFHNNISIRD